MMALLPKRIQMDDAKEVKYQLDLLDLFADDIINRIAVNHSNLGELAGLVREQDLKRLHEVCQYNWTYFAEQLWRLLFEAPTHSALYDAVLSFLYHCEGDSQMHRRLRLLDEHSHRSDILPILSHAKDFIDVMDPLVVSEELSLVSEHHKRVMLPVGLRFHTKGRIVANKYILSALPDLGQDTLFDFMHAIAMCGDKGRSLVEKLYPNFDRYYQLLLKDRQEGQLRGVVYHVPLGTPLREVVEVCGQSGPNQYQIDLRFQCLPPPCKQMCIDAALHALYDEDVMCLRQYQEELAEPAYKGHNTVVCAPTGSGKTLVAASVIRNHFIDGLLHGTPNRVCFFVTNTTFLDQQADLLRKFLNNKWKVLAVSGETFTSVRVPTLLDNDVIVITPQLIVNLLRCRSDEDSVMSFSLTMFSLLVFDEAHHADESHPYNELMIAYHDLKRTGRIPSSQRLPQVLGLTASLGVGRAKDEEEARKHILKMCANLDAHVLSRVRRNTSGLLSHSRVAVDETVLVESMHKSTPFYCAVDQCMYQFEKRFINKASQIGMSNFKFVSGDVYDANPPRERDIPAYEAWFETLLSKVIPELSNIESEDRKDATECLQNIKLLYQTLQLCSHFPCHIAQKYLISALSSLNDSAQSSSIIQECGVVTAHSDDGNRLYETLVRELHTEFRTKPEGRAIVFVRTREFAGRLRDALNVDSELVAAGVNSGLIIGVNVSRDEGGQSCNAQREMLNEFANGNVKVLCATSVAEEGIDIQKCSLVIKYNHATNEIAHVQRRGRGRAEGSRCLLLTNDGALANRESQNILREKLMAVALNMIDSKPTAWFRQEVEKQVNAMNAARQTARALNFQRIENRRNDVFSLRCRKCDAMICSSVDIVNDPNGSQFLCVDAEIWSRVECNEYCENVKLRDVRFTLKGVGQHRCISCHEQWGRIVKTKGVTLPVVAAKAFILQSSSNERFSCKRWKQVTERHFTPRTIETIDYANMKQAPMHPEYEDAC